MCNKARAPTSGGYLTVDRGNVWRILVGSRDHFCLQAGAGINLGVPNGGGDGVVDCLLKRNRVDHEPNLGG